MTPSEIAIKYIGQTEKPGNMGFNNADFERKMLAVGFQKTNAWCSYFQELIFKEAYPEKFKQLDTLFSASAVQTFRNFRDASFLVHELPEKDCLVLWQMKKEGKAQWNGHAGIVVNAIDQNTFESVEGNTNDAGGREGYIVARRIRKIVHNLQNGLEILGFIKI